MLFRSIIDDELEVRESGSVRVRHEGQSQQIVRRREVMGWFCRRWGSDGAKGNDSIEALSAARGSCLGGVKYDIPRIMQSCPTRRLSAFVYGGDVLSCFVE